MPARTASSETVASPATDSTVAYTTGDNSDAAVAAGGGTVAQGDAAVAGGDVYDNNAAVNYDHSFNEDSNFTSGRRLADHRGRRRRNRGHRLRLMSTSAPAGDTSDLTDILQGLRTDARELDREDLARRLDSWVERLDQPKVRVVVVGPFNQGKSTLVNTVVGAPICPVDDIAMTAIPTIIEYGPEPSASLTFDVPGENRSTRIPIDINDLRKHVMDHAANTGSLDGGKVEVTLPAEPLRGGLVMVDTPGVGSAVARHAVTTLALLPSADALVVLSDASQELTEPELSFLRQAATICPIVMCVLSKIDQTPHWRDVEAANRQHLESAGIDATILPVSANLYRTALTLDDTHLPRSRGSRG